MHTVSTKQCIQDDYKLHCRFRLDVARNVSTNVDYMVFAQVSFNATVRLKTRCPGVLSLSTVK